MGFKFGLAGLNQAINCEERQNGVRASAIFPDDIDTPLLDRRPVPPDAAARAKMMKAEDIADCALLLPPPCLLLAASSAEQELGAPLS